MSIPMPLYASTIHEAVARGDLDEMKKLEAQAQEHLSEWGNVPAAVEVLRAEIAKASASGAQ
jgi:hypothetical protein